MYKKMLVLFLGLTASIGVFADNDTQKNINDFKYLGIKFDTPVKELKDKFYFDCNGQDTVCKKTVDSKTMTVIYKNNQIKTLLTDTAYDGNHFDACPTYISSIKQHLTDKQGASFKPVRNTIAGPAFEGYSENNLMAVIPARDGEVNINIECKGTQPNQYDIKYKITLAQN